MNNQSVIVTMIVFTIVYVWITYCVIVIFKKRETNLQRMNVLNKLLFNYGLNAQQLSIFILIICTQVTQIVVRSVNQSSIILMSSLLILGFFQQLHIWVKSNYFRMYTKRMIIQALHYMLMIWVSTQFSCWNIFLLIVINVTMTIVWLKLNQTVFNQANQFKLK